MRSGLLGPGRSAARLSFTHSSSSSNSSRPIRPRWPVWERSRPWQPKPCGCSLHTSRLPCSMRRGLWACQMLLQCLMWGTSSASRPLPCSLGGGLATSNLEQVASRGYSQGPCTCRCQGWVGALMLCLCAANFWPGALTDAAASREHRMCDKDLVDASQELREALIWFIEMSPSVHDLCRHEQ